MMPADILFPIIGGVIALFFLWYSIQEDSGLSALICLVIAGWMFWCAYDNHKPEVRAAKAAEEAAEEAAENAAKHAKRVAEETPHVIREADGCKVYAFKAADRWHYFTRCPGEKVVTSGAYEHCTGSGKSRSCKELHEDIETN